VAKKIDWLSADSFDESSSRSRGSGRKKKARLYTRINPETGGRVRMTRDDERWDDYVSVSEYRRSGRALERGLAREEKAKERKEQREEKKREKEVEKLGKQVGSAAIDWLSEPGAAGSKSTLKRLGDLPVKKAVGLIGKTPVIGTVMLAGVASYYATTWIMDYLAKRKDAGTPEAQRFAAAMAYRKAREDAAAKLGRPLNAAEQDVLATQFKAKLKTIPGVK
jgi:hypothetical protein